MKKKFNFWLQIVTICLCICAIAVGVYSATTASITAGGKVAFSAHNCKVSVSGYIYGHGMKDNQDHQDGSPVAEQNATPLNGGTPIEVEGGVSTPAQSTLPLGTRYFSDVESSTGKPEDIYIVISATNTSEHYQVTATVDTSSAYTVFANGKIIATPMGETSVILDTTGTGATATFKFKLEMQATNGVYESFAQLQDVALKIDFEKKYEFIYDAENHPYLSFGSYDSDNFTAAVTDFNESVTEVVIPEKVKYGNEVYYVTEIASNAFQSATITSIDIPDTIKAIGSWAFNGCSSIKSIELPIGFESFGLGAFSYSGLESITISKNVKTIGSNAFLECSELKSITFEEGANPTFVGSCTFMGCSSLNSVKIPSSITTYALCMFDECSSLTEVYIDSAAFINCGSIKNSSMFNYTQYVYVQKDIVVTDTGFETDGTIVGDYKRYTESYNFTYNDWQGGA